MRMKDEASESLIEGSEVSRHIQQRLSLGSFVHWALTIFFLCTTLFLALERKWTKPEQSYGNGFSTDFVSHSPQIPISIIKKRFTNDLLFNTTSQTFYNQPLTSNEETYSGPSTPAIDAAWKSLLHAQYIALLPEEATQIPPSHIAPIFYNGEHHFLELAVFHNLHCLNEIRTALDGEYYGHHHSMRARDGTNMMHEGRVHLDHCVDQIRQAIMCHSDLTPVPMMPIDGLPDAYIGNGEEHTCRDFEAIWEWVEERGKKMKALGD